MEKGKETCNSLENSQMNLDALIEDLEAQGYFQSNVRLTTYPESDCKLVRVELGWTSHLLSSVLLGSDFLAGFELANDSLRWLIIPIKRIFSIQAIDNGSKLLETEANLTALLQLKLLGRSLKIISIDQTISAQLVRASEHYLQLSSETQLWIPLANLGVVVVEKFSDLN